MNYLKLYQKTIIPNMRLEGLKEQKELFKGSNYPEDVKIREAIEEKIAELELFTVSGN